MLRIVDFRDADISKSEMRARLPRAQSNLDEAMEVASRLVVEVRERGEEALRAQAERFDGVSGHAIRVPQEHVDSALDTLSPLLREALEESIRRVRLASQAGVPPEVTTDIAPGARITQRWVPVDRVGLYVPGGKAVYPSSVVMNVVAAQTAEVRSIAIASPPQPGLDGRVHPTILATAAILGVDEIYAMGGAGAIGAFASGVASIGLEPVSVITGPGNLYVAAAKRAVRGTVGIDSEAGPTEILVIADETAVPELVAADLVSQAEHDESASAILVTTSPELMERVQSALEVATQSTEHAHRVRAALTGEQSGVILVSSLTHAVEVSNLYAPEHVEVHTADDHDIATSLRNAGVIFVGHASPVSLGDYLAGSNHVLPTAGHAAFSSALGPYTFLRAQQVVEYSPSALQEVAHHIRVLAEDENLPAHADAIDARFSVSTKQRG